MRPLETAMQMAKAGFYVFPVVPEDKTPLVKWQDASTRDEAVITGWLNRWPTASYGIDCEKSGLCVVDLDVKGGNNGIAEFEKLAAENGGIVETRRVRTPSGGMHLYFRGQTASRINLRPGIDIRSAIGYVVGPGSLRDGKYYVDAQNAVPAVLPEWLSQVIGAATKKDPTAPILPAPFVTKPEDYARAEEWLKTARPAIAGQGGDNWTFAVAAKLKDFGVSELDTLHLMNGDWNDQCDPPWALEELTAKVAHAFRYGSRPPGEQSLAVFERTLPENRIIHISAFVNNPPPKRRWVIDNWVPHGTAVLLAGEGGVGKSAILIEACIAVASGQPWLGLTVSQPMPTLLVSCEDAADELHRRIHAMARAPEYAMLGLDKTPCWTFPRVGLESRLMQLRPDGKTPMDGGFLAILEHQLSREMPKGPKLLVLDTVPDTFGGNENDRAHVNFFSKQTLGGLILRHDLTIICNAHPAKAEGSEYSGSTAWNGAFRARLQMSYHADGDDFRMLELKKSNYSKAGASVILRRGDDGVFRAVTADESMADACACVLAAIRDAERVGAWLSTSPVPGHSLSKYLIENRAGRPISDAVKLEAARTLLAKGELVETLAPSGKSRMLKSVSTTSMWN